MSSSDPIEIPNQESPLGVEASTPQMGRMVKSINHGEYSGEIFEEKWNDVSLEIKNADFEESVFVNIDWNSAQMETVVFDLSTFIDCRFENLSAELVGFNNAHMIRVCFANSDLSFSVFKSVRMFGKEEKSLLFKNKMFSCNFDDSELEKVVIKECEFQSAQFKKAEFKDCIFNKVDFSDADFQEAEFQNCKIKDCKWRGANLEGVHLDGQIDNFRQLDAAKNENPEDWKLEEI